MFGLVTDVRTIDFIAIAIYAKPERIKKVLKAGERRLIGIPRTSRQKGIVHSYFYFRILHRTVFTRFSNPPNESPPDQNKVSG